MRVKLDLSDLQRVLAKETAKKKAKYLNSKRYKKGKDKVKLNFSTKKLN